MNGLERTLAEADGGHKAAMARLFELLRFPTIATDPAYDGECRKCAEWVAAELKSLGFDTQIRPTTGQPVVVGKFASPGLPSHAPHILFYGHYDVQPPDPLELWESPPFEPTIRKNARGKDAIYARGAHDDKGQFMTFLEASRAWLKVHGGFPFRLTVLIEGDEEGDDSHLDRFLKENRKEFACDVAWVCDTEMWDDETPCLPTRLRGCLSVEFEIEGPRIDLHSGYYGGPVRNPIHVLADVLGGLHNKKGRIAIPGFFDGVLPVSKKERAAWAALKFDSKAFMKDVGVSIPAGERGYSALEQIWMRPTAEVNGVTGGYQGAGSKTVLPARASAKMTFRTIPGQTAKNVIRTFQAYVKSKVPRDCKVSFNVIGGDNEAVVVDAGNPYIGRAARALKDEWGREPVLPGDGGSIPVVSTIKRVLKADSVLMGFSRSDDAAHSPNEKYDVECFNKGVGSWIRLIAACAA